MNDCMSTIKLIAARRSCASLWLVPMSKYTEPMITGNKTCVIHVGTSLVVRSAMANE